MSSLTAVFKWVVSLHLLPCVSSLTAVFKWVVSLHLLPCLSVL